MKLLWLSYQNGLVWEAAVSDQTDIARALTGDSKPLEDAQEYLTRFDAAIRRGVPERALLTVLHAGADKGEAWQSVGTWRPRQMVDSAKALELYQRLGTYAAVAEVMDLSPEGARRAVIRGRKSAQPRVVQYSRAAVKAVQTRHVTARAGSSDRARGSAVASRG